jgi:hypothetical protein
MGKVRRLSDEEGRHLQRIVSRGGGKTDKSIVKWRPVLVFRSSAGGNDVAVIARLVQTSPDRVREMIHSFDEKGIAPWTLSGRVAVPPGSRLKQGLLEIRPHKL